MKEFTVDNMIQACRLEPTKKRRLELFEAFRRMSFHGFINEETFDAFCVKWNELGLNR